MKETEGKKKFDKKLLLLPLLSLLLIPLLAARRALGFLNKRKERAAVKALARQLVQERKSGRKSGKSVKGKKAGKASVKVVVREAAESRAGVITQVKNLLSKRMVKFILMALAERIIAAQRAKMKESLPSIPLSGRLSKAKDI